jgi:HrpA-like RNA helicase
VSLLAAVVDEAELEEAAAAKQVAADRAAAAAAGPTRVVHLTRPPEIEEVRRQLPIIGLEQEIMEGINHNDVVVSGRVMLRMPAGCLALDSLGVTGWGFGV